MHKKRILCTSRTLFLIKRYENVIKKNPHRLNVIIHVISAHLNLGICFEYPTIYEDDVIERN